ncbi:MAG: hypothetical protein BGO95_06520 [Micrococcales bacterium 73-13]|nr:MAG: hypothetical protein BGO95_06520 [Micrococcales bacterium 73-13]
MTEIPFPPFEPSFPWAADVLSYGQTGPMIAAMEFTGWRHESTAWKDSAYLGASLGISPTYRITGPGARRFFEDRFVNDFSRLRVGGIRHGIMLDDEGRILADGVVMRTGEEEYLATWLSPAIDWAFESGAYDAVGENVTGQVFLFQVAGPRSLEILERATGEDLHDIAFARHRESSIEGRPVRILRLGMAGTLSYEVHGAFPDAHAVYQAIRAAGAPYGLVRQGKWAYMLNHTEDGFPQAYYHFPYPWYETPDFAAWLDARPGAGFFADRPRLLGSAGTDAAKRYLTPFDAGWGDRIDWDHDFVGKEAARRLSEAPPRQVVTLEWDGEDIADVWASQYREGPVYDQFDRPAEIQFDSGTFDERTGQFRTMGFRADLVLDGDREVGITTGRATSMGYRRMISLAFIEPALAEEGTGLVVLWGQPDGPQKRIRARVARYPYLDAVNNRDFDVETIPHPANAG